jgi:hypothetical protein
VVSLSRALHIGDALNPTNTCLWVTRHSFNLKITLIVVSTSTGSPFSR